MHNTDQRDNFTSVLADLLSSRHLRETFAKSPDQVLDTYKVSSSDHALLLSLSIPQLEQQASVLLYKRLHEVQNLMPATFDRAKVRYSQMFLEYADRYWPEGHRKHVLDAIRFTDYLTESGHLIDKQETDRLRFINSSRSLTVHFYRRVWIAGRHRFSLSVLFKIRRRCFVRRIYL